MAWGLPRFLSEWRSAQHTDRSLPLRKLHIRQAEGQQCGEQGAGAWLSQAQPGDAGAGRCGDRVGDGGQGGGSGDRVMVESLDAQQASVGGEADLAECRQVGQPFPDGEVAGGVDGGLGS